MASPVDAPVSSVRSREASSSTPIPLSASPSIPNIPPRAGPSSFTPRSLKSPPVGPPSPNSLASKPSKSALHRPSQDDIGRKASPAPVAGSSALTAQFDKDKDKSRDESLLQAAPASGEMSRRPSANIPSGASTPVNAANGNEFDSSFSNIVNVGATDEEKAKVIRRHLVSADERGGSSRISIKGDATPAGESGIASADGEGSNHDPDDEQFPIPYDAPGGDVTHDIYKWQHDRRPRPGRSASFSHAERQELDPQLAHLREPGGFRRNFVMNRAQEQGLEAPTIVRNVIDFLFLYGHFAGEDLAEDEDVLDDDEEDENLSPSAAESGRGRSNERTPLLRGQSTRHRRSRSTAAAGTASTTQAVLMLLKGFIGTGILFMGKAFFNGGLLFSTIVMLFIAGISLFSFLLLIQSWMVVPASFGDIGGALYGKYMRLNILASITVSQIGFVAAYCIFIAENLQAFILAVTDCKTFVPTKYLIFAELIVFLPLAMVRNLAKLSGTALVADAFILVGLIYLAVQEFTVLGTHGIADVKLFNKQSYSLLIGTAVFAFEGIGLVIPITESMREPKKLPVILCAVMAVVATLFAGFGALGYMAYGSDIQTVVIVNLPQNDKFVQALQFLYSIAILLSIPLQLFPAVRIMENGLFSKSGKHNPSVKWQKNVFRAGTVIFCSLLSWAGSAELDKFVALIGAFACIPLCFIYPPLLHYKACAKTKTAKAIDLALLIFGVSVGVFTTIQTIISLFEPSSGSPQFGKCKVPQT